MTARSSSRASNATTAHRRRLGDRLDVRARIGHIGNSSFAFDYQVVEASDGRLVADGRSVQVMFDYEAQRSRPVPADFKARVANFEA